MRIYDRMCFVADMHELVNPNESARRMLATKSPTDTELEEIYHNSEDPLVKALTQAKRDADRCTAVISLGDMIVNRVDLGEGTEKTIIGKLAREARERGVPQHQYVLDNIEAHRQRVQEVAHRNNLWTGMRFKRFEEIMKSGKSDRTLTFFHLNGNADVLSSLVSEAVLPDEETPTRIYARTFGLGRYFGQLPEIVPFATSYCDDCDRYSGTFGLFVPYTTDFTASKRHLTGLMSELKQQMKKDERIIDLLNPAGCFDTGDETEALRVTNTNLFIHEPLDFAPFGREETIEGKDAYAAAIELARPPVYCVVHGHTHKPNVVKYTFEGVNKDDGLARQINVIQVCPNRLVGGAEVFHIRDNPDRD